MDGRYLPASFTLDSLLETPAGDTHGPLESLPLGETAEGPLLPPVEPTHEVWASGVTYLISRFESKEANIYDQYDVFSKLERYLKVCEEQGIEPKDLRY